MSKLRWVFCSTLVLLLCVTGIAPAQTILFDDFQRANSSTVGGPWIETETVIPSSDSLSTNRLKLSSATAGRDYVLADVSAQYNTVFNSNSTTLTWAFNMRQSRTDPSGFDGSNYGAAFILGSSTNTLAAGSGYAVVLGNTGTSDNLRLVRYTGGILANASITNIIAPVVDYGSDYLTVKVVYNPVGNLWSLHVGSNLAFFDDPNTATYTQLGATTADATYTGIDLLFLGCLWNHATSATDFAWFDNVRIPNACTVVAEPTIQATGLTFSATGANATTLNFTRGNGTSCIIIGSSTGTVTATPVDGAAYIANTSFGSGSLMALGQYVVYAGNASSVLITNLAPTTTYQFKIFEYNGTGCTSNYLITSPATGNVTTTACVLAAEPVVPSSNLTVSNVFPTSLDLSWARGNGAYCIVLGKAVSVVTTPPVDGTGYTASPNFGTGNSTAAGEYVVYSGTGNLVSVTGLLPNTAYYFTVYEFNGLGCTANYFTTASTSINTTTPNVASYNYYYGTLHTHSDYSDGDMDNICNGAGSATCCYDIGNSALNFDYMGISDHNHNEGPVMTPAKYASGLSEAASYNSTHNDFVAFYGMEFGTISTGGHATVFGINQLMGWNTGNYNLYCAKGDYNTLFNTVAATPNAFATLCHPNATDFNNIANIAYNATWDNAITGVAVRNGPYNSTSIIYNDPSGTNNLAYFQRLLSKGYHLGPMCDLDNHNSATMGKCSQQRTVLVAQSLTQPALLDAVLNMHFFASDDYNATVDYRINSSLIMGSIGASTNNPSISVIVNDANGEISSAIRLFYGVPGSNILPVQLFSVNNSNTLNFTHNIAANSTFYYYAEIQQPDGNMIWTSPVWYTKQPVPPLPVTLLSFAGSHQKQGNVLQWVTAGELNNDYFTLFRKHANGNFEAIANVDGNGTTNNTVHYSFTDKTFSNGINYYRLEQVDFNGNATSSEIISINNSNLKPTELFIFPNPATESVYISINDGMANSTLTLYDVLGKLVLQQQVNAIQAFEINVKNLANGSYVIALENGNEILRGRFVKD